MRALETIFGQGSSGKPGRDRRTGSAATSVEELIAEEVERVRVNGLLRDRVWLEQDGRRVLAYARVDAKRAPAPCVS